MTIENVVIDVTRNELDVRFLAGSNGSNFFWENFKFWEENKFVAKPILLTRVKGNDKITIESNFPLIKLNDIK